MKRTWTAVTLAGSALAATGLLVRYSGQVVERRARKGRAKPAPRIERAVTIARPAAELYALWRDFEKLPAFLPSVESVEVEGRRSRWRVRGPGGTSLAWEAELVHEEPGRRISWRTLGSGPQHRGSVMFTAAPGDKGTEVLVEIEPLAPAGPLAGLPLTLASLPGRPLVDIDLRHFKTYAEVGEQIRNGTDPA